MQAGGQAVVIGLSVPPSTHQQPALSRGSYSLPLQEQGEFTQHAQGEIFIRLLKGKPGRRLGRRRGESAQTRAGSSTPLAATGAVAKALLSPTLAAGVSPVAPSSPPWGSPVSPSPGVLQRESGHSGSGLLLAHSVATVSKGTGTSNFGPELWASRCLEAAPRAGVNGEKLGTPWMEWLHISPMLQPQPGKCCPKTRGKAGRGPGRRGAKWGQGLLKGKQTPSRPITSSSCSTASLEEQGGQDQPQISLSLGPRTEEPFASPVTDIPGHVFQVQSRKQTTK